MADQWYVAREKKKLGPYSSEQLKALAGKGQLAPTDMLLKQGEVKWAPASTVGGLFSEQPTARPANGQGEETTPLSIPTLQVKAEAWMREQFATNPQRVFLASGGVVFGFGFVICLGCIGLLSTGNNGGGGSGESEGSGTTDGRASHGDELDRKINAQMGKVTNENVRRIHRGMTESEVEAILGRTAIKGDQGQFGYSRTYYGFGQATLTIFYTRGGVVDDLAWRP